MGKVTKTKSIQNFKKLVKILVNRYEWENFSKKVTRKNNPEEVPTIVFLVGAGLSKWSKKKMWNEIRDKIYDTIIKSYGNKEIIINEIWSANNNKLGVKHPDWDLYVLENKLTEALKNKIIDIEDIASVACRFHKSDEKIRELLIETYGLDREATGGHPPQLGYELLAHFLKHSFCDHILTFNFDEILDIALENELGKENYEKIISEHDVFSHSNKNKKYIKLHGSVSSPQSLKFTAENTGKLSNRMIQILDESIFYISKNENSTSKIPELNKKITIISLGYSWEDEDIANWIKSRQKHIEALYILTGRSKKVPKNLNGLDNKLLNLICNSYFHEQLFIDQFLWLLWNSIEKKISDLPYVPASRHLILGHLFGLNIPNYMAQKHPEKTEPRFLNAHLIDRRLRMEIFLHLIKCRGMINMSVMASIPKINRYFKLFKKQIKTHGENLLDSYKSFLIKDNSTKMRESYFSKGSNIEKNITYFEEVTQFSRNNVFIPKFDKKTGSFKFEEEPRNSFWLKELDKIFRGPEIEIMPGLDPRASWAFKSPITLNNFHELSTCTKTLLNSPWTHLLMIAETGEWLFTDKKFDKIFKNGKKDIFLIKTFPPENTKIWVERKIIDKSVEKAISKKKKLNYHEAKLEWWEHERHLTLAMDIKDGKVNFLGGIYFLRRLKTTQISPIFLDNPQDCCELFNIFKLYSEKAVKHGGDHISSNYVESLNSIENMLYNNDNVNNL